MADLEAAAAEALEKVKALAALTDKAHSRLDEITQEIEAAGESVQADWERFVEQARAMGERATATREELAGAADEALRQVGELQGALTGAAAQAEADLTSASEGTADLGRAFEAARPDVTGMREAVESASEELTRRAAEVEEALQQAIDQARAFVEEQVAGDLRELQERVREGAQQVTAAMDECAEQLQASYDEWEEGLSEVETEVEEAFQEAEEHLTGLVGTATQLAEDAYVQPLTELQADLSQLGTLLEEVATAVGGASEQAAPAAAATTESMDQDRAALEAVRAKLAEVTALLASFSFVSV